MNISPELFRDAFIAAFKINRHLIKFTTNRQRTSHMISHIYRTIADYLDLNIDYEYQTIDTVFYSREAKEVNEETIKVAIEHENGPNTAHAELRKLVSYNFPLSVLITYPWNGREGGQLVMPDFHLSWFSRRGFDSILSSKSQVKQVLIIVPDVVIAHEQTWCYYVYRDQSFEELK
jgi:hypothetical protein